MPKTNAEWRELDEQLAREVMGWCKWGELPEAARRAYWEALGEGPDEYRMTHNGLRWWYIDELGCPDTDYRLSEWQPHEDVAQALMALDTVAEKYPDVGYTLERATPKRLRGYMCALGNPDAPETLAFAPTLREAICSALEKWMDAQEKP